MKASNNIACAAASQAGFRQRVSVCASYEDTANHGHHAANIAREQDCPSHTSGGQTWNDSPAHLLRWLEIAFRKPSNRIDRTINVHCSRSRHVFLAHSLARWALLETSDLARRLNAESCLQASIGALRLSDTEHPNTRYSECSHLTKSHHRVGFERPRLGLYRPRLSYFAW